MVQRYRGMVGTNPTGAYVLYSDYAALEQRCKELEDELETERIRLAGCGVAAMCNTEQSIKQQRISKDSPYYSASYQDVCDAVDREMKLRAENAELCKQLELEHNQGEAFIVQIKELIKDRDRLPINIILDAPPSHDSGRFVEVETDDGKSIRAGEWIEKDGYWALRITELPKAIDTEMDSEWEIEFIR